jgi:hypothetical protein
VGGKSGEIKIDDPAPAAAQDGEELTPGGLRRGRKVVLGGLQGAPHHNGKEGRVQSFVAEKGRYVVALTSGETLSLKPDNLEVI